MCLKSRGTLVPRFSLRLVFAWQVCDRDEVFVLVFRERNPNFRLLFGKRVEREVRKLDMLVPSFVALVTVAGEHRTPTVGRQFPKLHPLKHLVIFDGGEVLSGGNLVKQPKAIGVCGEKQSAIGQQQSKGTQLGIGLRTREVSKVSQCSGIHAPSMPFVGK